MQELFDKFNNMIDTKALALDVKEYEKTENKQTSFDPVPLGDYEVAVEKLELTESKAGRPMAVCWMKIVSGEFKNNRLFMNQVVEQSFQIGIMNKFLRELTESTDFEGEVTFQDFGQYAGLLLDIMEAIDHKFEYLVKYGQTPKGYSTFHILETYKLGG